MARLPRLKAANGAFYHLYARVSGYEGYYPLADDEVRRRLIDDIKLYTDIYKVEVAGFNIMGNHYHLVVRFEEFRNLDKSELKKIALKLYKTRPEVIKIWNREKWEHFNRRIFDVSEFMRNIQARFAKWYNLKRRRKGKLWGDRFKSTLLEDEKALRDCLYYVELNAVRANIVQRPEEYEGGSLFHREIKTDKWMMNILDIVPAKSRKTALSDYKAGIYYRGNVRTKASQKEIPDHIIKEEEKRGFKTRGAYSKRVRYFVNGVAIGSREFINEHLENLRIRGEYVNRKNPMQAEDEASSYLRAQRNSEVYIV